MCLISNAENKNKEQLARLYFEVTRNPIYDDENK